MLYQYKSHLCCLSGKMSSTVQVICVGQVEVRYCIGVESSCTSEVKSSHQRQMKMTSAPTMQELGGR